MSTAQRILVVYGSLSIVYGMALGLPLSGIRMSSPRGPRHLVTAHLSALMQGSMHLGLSVAVGFATLTPWVLTASAISLVCGSVLFVGGATVNWLMKVDDHFAERSQGWYLLSASGPLHLTGAVAVLVGVVRTAMS
jgi:hypothetical protein